MERPVAFVDTNLLIRFLTQDDPEQSPLAVAYFSRVQKGEYLAVISDSVIFETVYVLEGRKYRISRSEIAHGIGKLLVAEGIVLVGVIDYDEVFALYVLHEQDELSFADCAHAWLAQQHCAGRIVSFDVGLDSVANLDRIDLAH